MRSIGLFFLILMVAASCGEPLTPQEEAIQTVRNALCDPDNEDAIVENRFVVPEIKGVPKEESEAPLLSSSSCCNATRMLLLSDGNNPGLDYKFFRPAYEDNPNCVTYGIGVFYEYHPGFGPDSYQVLTCDFKGIELLDFVHFDDWYTARLDHIGTEKNQAFFELMENRCTTNVVQRDVGLPLDSFCLNTHPSAPCAKPLKCLPYTTKKGVESLLVGKCQPVNGDE